MPATRADGADLHGQPRRHNLPPLRRCSRSHDRPGQTATATAATTWPGDWCSCPADQEWSVYAKEAYYTGHGSRLRRFTYRPDGSSALQAGDGGGEAITRPLSFSGSKLVLNYRAAPKGSLRVELQDAGGQPIEGFTAAESHRLSGDALDAVATWSKDADLESLAGQPLRLRFVLNDAELFAFRFSKAHITVRHCLTDFNCSASGRCL